MTTPPVAPQLANCDCTKSSLPTSLLNGDVQCAVQCIINSQLPVIQAALQSDLGNAQSILAGTLNQASAAAQQAIATAQGALQGDITQLQGVIDAEMTNLTKVIDAAIDYAQKSVEQLLADEASLALHAYATDIALIITVLLGMRLLVPDCFPEWMLFAISSALVLSLPATAKGYADKVALPAMLAMLVVAIYFKKNCRF